MEQTLQPQFGWREVTLLLLVFAPLLYLLYIYGAPIPQDKGHHIFADARTCPGLPNFGNVVSNILFLAFGVAGML